MALILLMWMLLVDGHSTDKIDWIWNQYTYNELILNSWYSSSWGLSSFHCLEFWNWQGSGQKGFEPGNLLWIGSFCASFAWTHHFKWPCLWNGRITWVHLASLLLVQSEDNDLQRTIHLNPRLARCTNEQHAAWDPKFNVTLDLLIRTVVLFEVVEQTSWLLLKINVVWMLMEV